MARLAIALRMMQMGSAMLALLPGKATATLVPWKAMLLSEVGKKLLSRGECLSTLSTLGTRHQTSE